LTQENVRGTKEKRLGDGNEGEDLEKFGILLSVLAYTHKPSSRAIRKILPKFKKQG